MNASSLFNIILKINVTKEINIFIESRSYNLKEIKYKNNK